jgi:hypothetical protein
MALKIRTGCYRVPKVELPEPDQTSLPLAGEPREPNLVQIRAEQEAKGGSQSRAKSAR